MKKVNWWGRRRKKVDRRGLGEEEGEWRKWNKGSEGGEEEEKR